MRGLRRWLLWWLVLSAPARALGDTVPPRSEETKPTPPAPVTPPVPVPPPVVPAPPPPKLVTPPSPSEPRVAVLGFDLHGLPAGARPGFEASLEVGLSNAGWSVVGQAQTQELLAKAQGVVPGCRMGPCLATVGLALHSRYVVHGSVEVRGAEFDVLVTLLDTRHGDPVGQVVKACAVCTVDDALVALSATGEELRPPVAPSPWLAPAPRFTWRSRVGWGGLALGGLALLAGALGDSHVGALFTGGFTAFAGGVLLIGSDQSDHPTAPANTEFGIRMRFKW